MDQLCPFAIDLTAALKPGVFLFGWRGRVVYVGKAHCILAALSNHMRRNHLRSSGEWLGLRSMNFDQIEIIPCDTVRASALAKALIDLHNPIHNRPPRTPQPSPFHIPTSPANPNHVRRI